MDGTLPLPLGAEAWIAARLAGVTTGDAGEGETAAAGPASRTDAVDAAAFTELTAVSADSLCTGPARAGRSVLGRIPPASMFPAPLALGQGFRLEHRRASTSGTAMVSSPVAARPTAIRRDVREPMKRERASK
jgi:hypothetical protein